MQYVVPSLSNLYSKSYDDRMKEWRRIGSIKKAENIARLLAQGGIDTQFADVLEVGCGTGDVLAQIIDRGMAGRYVGIEITEERVDASETVNRQPMELYSYNGHVIPFEDESFDFVHATHVLEHVVDEREFLHELRRVARRYIYIEVPCELTLRGSRMQLQKTLNIGHINSYTPESFALTLATSGLKVIEFCGFDHNMECHRFESSLPSSLVKMIVRRSFLAANPFLASRLFTYHWGALCVRADKLDIS